MLKVKDLCFGYIKKSLIIKDLNFLLNDGESLLLIGGEGMGKTSLLKVLCGLEKQYAGSIMFDNKELSCIEGKNKSITYLPSDPVFFENKSIQYNIDYLFGVNSLLFDREKILERFKIFNFDVDLKTKVKKLSLCDKRIFALIRASFKDSEYCFIDDQFDNLDDELCKKIKTAITAFINLKNVKTKYIFGFNCVDSVKNITYNKCVYLSYANNFYLNKVDDLLNNPVDLYSKNYVCFNEKNMLLTNKNGNYFLCEYEEVFDKKRKNVDFKLKNMVKIDNNLINNCVLSEDEYLKTIVLFTQTIKEFEDLKFNNLLNKSIFVFDEGTGSRLFN